MPRRRDHRARWGTSPEPLMLKFRVIATERMRKSDMLRKLKEAVRRGVVPQGITIRWMDWAKGNEGELRTGQIPAHQLSAMRDFYKALTAGNMRAERVEQ